MTKARKTKKASADSVYAKKSNAAAKVNPFVAATPATSKKLNPFEVHINKEKFQILGRTCKHDKGLPGVSRAKAVKKRKETLGKEFQQKNKTNQFKDRRIGRHLQDSHLNEEIMNARFIAEKMSQLKQGKSSRFNLNDDEVLTHRGQTLEDIQNFRDERSDDEDLEDERLDADFTEAAHFGGDDAQVKDRNAAIDDMILQQKKRKIEIAKEKDEVHDLTVKLDTNYNEILGIMRKMKKSEMKAKPEPDDYDKKMREMIFEPRGAVTDKLQSEEDIAKKEKERLEKLENERLRRMQADDEGHAESAQPQHRSADDLDDGYLAYGEVEEEDGCLAYNMDGKLSTKITKNDHQVTDEDEVVNEVGDVDEDKSDAGKAEDDDEGSEEEEEESDDEGSEEEESEEDDLEDLKSSASEDEQIKEDEVKSTVMKEKQKAKRKPVKVKETKTDLPFTMELPESYKEFHSLLAKYSADDQGVIVERLIKCNHPKLEGVNREIVVKLFAYLLQYVNELFADASQDDVAEHFKILDRLNPHLYDLMHLNPQRMSTTLLTVIKEKYEEFRKNSKQYPGLETIVFLKLVSNFFSTSDFRHPVVTPCYIFIQHILSRAQVRTRQDIALGLFLVTITLEYSQHSKRFLAAVFNFLLGLLFLSIPKRAIEVWKIVPPFQNTGPMSKLLAIGENTEKDNMAEERLTSEDLVVNTLTTDFKIKALNTSLLLVKDAIGNFGENIGACYLAQPLLDMMERIPLDVYPKFVHDNYATAREALIEVATKPLIKITPPAKKPKALRLLEPRIETVYDDKRRPKLTKEKEEKVKLLHKLKRETKGAVREIRRDTEFLQKMRIQQQIQSDTERKEKVKRIYQEASVQQGELNELARANKKKKF